MNYDENRPQHACDELAPGAEHGRGCDHDRGKVVEREVDQENIDDNATLLNNSAGSASGSCNGPANLALRFESVANKAIIPTNEYRSLMPGLNLKQKEIVIFHQNWCKEAVIALKHHKSLNLISFLLVV